MKRKPVKVEAKTAVKKTALLRGRVPADLKEKVLSVAAKKFTTEAQIVRQAVSEWLVNQEA